MRFSVNIIFEFVVIVERVKWNGRVIQGRVIGFIFLDVFKQGENIINDQMFN